MLRGHYVVTRRLQQKQGMEEGRTVFANAANM